MDKYKFNKLLFSLMIVVYLSWEKKNKNWNLETTGEFLRKKVQSNYNYYWMEIYKRISQGNNLMQISIRFVYFNFH